MSAAASAWPIDVQGAARPFRRDASLSAVSKRAAGDGELLHALPLQVRRRQLGHLARAEDQDVEPVELAEDLLRERDGGVADRHRPFAEARFVADALADAEGRA